jgi:anti-sigma28 factor (negative regulator of flagellin synthesis)
MRINAVTQPYSNELRKIESAKKAEKESKSSKVASADRSEFSSGAKRLSETKSQFETIAASLSAQPDIRLERIADVRRKIDNGYYDSEEFLDKLTNKMLNEFGIADK